MQGRNGKIILAVLGVILMIVFILPGSMQSMPGSDLQMGVIGERRVRQSDIIASSNLYDYATANILVPVGGDQYAPLTNAVFRDYAQTLSEDPELFHLLREEAEATGAMLPREPLEMELTRAAVVVVVNDRSAPNGRRQVPFTDLAGEQVRNNVLAAAGAVLSVGRSLDMYADYPRVSAPVVDYFVALQSQRADLRTVVFDAEKYLDQAPEPSQEAIAAHFEKHKETLPGRTSTENPFGFGYRLPSRVKLQYLTVSAEAVRQHVIDGLVQMPIAQRQQTLYRYWTENRARFPVPPSTQPASQPTTATTQPTSPETTPPVTQPTTGPATQPATQPIRPERPLLAAHNPEVQQFLDAQAAQVAGQSDEADWKSYVAVHDEVVARHVDQETAQLQGKISKRLRDVISSDFRAFDMARTATTRPKARAGVPVDDPQYLERLADVIAAELGVRPSASSYGRDEITYEQINDEKAVGPIAASFSPDLRAAFGNYVFAFTLDLLKDESRAQAERSGAGLSLLQPSQPLMDLAGNEYVFRVTEAHADAPAESLAQVQEKVRSDLRKRAAYDIALKEAQAFTQQARNTSFEAAAQSAGLTMHDPVAFVPGAGLLDASALGAPEGSGTISAAEREDFADSFYLMLCDRALAEEERPVGALPIRPAFRVVVAELQELIAGWLDNQVLSVQREQLQQQLRQQWIGGGGMPGEFFNFERAAKRVGYVRETPRTPATNPAAR